MRNGAGCVRNSATLFSLYCEKKCGLNVQEFAHKKTARNAAAADMSCFFAQYLAIMRDCLTTGTGVPIMWSRC